MKKKGKTILPRKLSSLIRIALKDIRKAEASDKAVVDMSFYFHPNQALDCMINGNTVYTKEVCVMCAAGSVMAFTLKAKMNGDRNLEPANFPGNHDQLYAIDALRIGDVLDAALTLGLVKLDEYGDLASESEAKFESFDEPIPEYEVQDPEPFHKAMEKLQAKLQKAGL